MPKARLCKFRVGTTQPMRPSPEDHAPIKGGRHFSRYRRTASGQI